MTEGPDETSETLKRIKQLENQNIKFKYLLEAVLELASQDAKGIANLQTESDSLKSKVERLEREKLQLEDELSTVLEDNGSEVIYVVRKLELENAELRTKFEEIVSKIKTEILDLNQLKAEDAELKNVLTELESEKSKLIEKIQKVGEASRDLNSNSQKLFEAENKRKSFEIQSSNSSLDESFKNRLQALQKQFNVKEKISELEHKNEELIKVVQKAESLDMSSQTKINEEIITSNTNFLNKVDKVRSRMEEINNNFVKTLERPKVLMEDKISELENAKLMLYKELEQYLMKSSSEISKLTNNISDPDIKRLVNEIEMQKTVLLYSLQSEKLNPYVFELDQNDISLPSIPDSNPHIDPSKIALFQPLPTHSSESQPAPSKDSKEMEPSTSKDDRQKLEQEVNRLEHERERLLEALRSVSATSANRPNENEVVTQNEIQLQTQSELHSTFMRESSHEIVVAQNYDDATNQLYADEDARLEQRIRELEIENVRIQRELDTILEEIRADKSEMSRLQFTGQALRERIDELEQSTVEKEN